MKDSWMVILNKYIWRVFNLGGKKLNMKNTKVLRSMSFSRFWKNKKYT